MIDRLLKWIEWPIHVLLWAAMAAGVAMMLHVSADVTARTVFNHPLPGTTEIVSAYYMVAACYLPWAWVARTDSHIVVELFTQLAPRRFNAWLDVGVKLFVVAYLFLFVWQTWARAIEQYRLGEVVEAGALYVTVWPSRLLLPLAGALMALDIALRVVADLRRLVRGGA